MLNEKQNIILIIANGQPPSTKVLRQLLRESDQIIAVDGGSVICFQNDVHPDFIVGDLDSIPPEAMEYFKNVKFIHQPDQNYHDLEKAIEFTRTLKPKLIKIAAVFGKRADQTLANLLTLQTQFEQVPMEFYDDYGRLEIITGSREINLPVGQLISLFSFLPVSGITLNGFKYPLKNADFPNGFIGLSNVIATPPAQIQIKQGFLYLYTLQIYD
jgi:thiamine pyrophosphokinase